MAKNRAIEQSEYEFPKFTGLLGLIPCKWEYIKSEEYKLISNTGISILSPYRLTVLPSAKTGNTLTKVVRKDFEEWKKIILLFCQGNRDYQTNDLRYEFLTTCISRNRINKCQKEIIDTYIKLSKH